MIPLLAIALLLVAGCERRDTGESEDQGSVSADSSRWAQPDPRFRKYQETGDLSAIKDRGTIRFVYLAEDPENYLPRSGIVSQQNVHLAERLAAKLGLKPHFTAVETAEEGIEMLNRGEADVFADNLLMNEERSETLGLSEPLRITEQVLVTGKKGPDLGHIKDLKDTEILVLSDSQLAKNAQQFAADNPAANLKVTELPASGLINAIKDSMDSSSPPIVLMPKNHAEDLQRYYPELKVSSPVGEPISLAWAVRKSAPELQTRINNFLTKTMVKAPADREADWDAIKASGVLRFATYNGPGYFIWKGVLSGLDYELVSAFAKANDLELQVIVVPDTESLIEYVESGRADLAGASTTMTEERRNAGIAFSAPILETSVVVMSSDGKAPIKTLQDLSGRTLTLRPDSAFMNIAKKLQSEGIDVKIETAPEEYSFEDIVEGVANGELDATLEDANLADLQRALYPQLQQGIAVSGPMSQGWMVLEGNRSLLDKLNSFLNQFLAEEKNRKMVDNYFLPESRNVERAKNQLQPGKALSPYDEIAKKYAAKHNLDWRMVVAQIWQESNFDPKAESHMGAQGLMQVMPRTAQEMGFNTPLFDPEHSVHAGTKYLDWLKERFGNELPADEKVWFSLAAYNAGIGHLRDAQELAKQLNLDPNKWFDNVEVAMLKLSEPRYFEKARYGYARGSEPVAYVRNIRNLYRAYTDMASGEVAQRQRGKFQPWNLFSSWASGANRAN
ncbi:transporter substrate-binding domain-containing protein [Microbulbifer aestuariivivens]|uniref:transporter substrate-binding domain-containing protein n=1 Tax=Microbulbifer aestuariivivens TaxID=1908308 RepID=UPI0031E60EA2